MNASTFVNKRLSIFLVAALLAGTLLAALPAPAAQSAAFSLFSPAANFATGALPHSVAVGDFDQNGQLDLAVANTSGNTVSVLRNDGSGGFLAQVAYAVGNSPSAVAVGDFNLDGWPDLAVANAGSDTVSMLANNGSGGFLAQVTHPVGNNPSAVAAGDINLDGWADLVVTNAGGDTVGVLANNGSGGFLAQVTYAVGISPSAVAVGDINLDGWLDLAVANAGSNTVSVLENNGSGGFLAQVPYSVGQSPQSVALADFFINDYPDLVTANSGSNNVSVLQNDGNAGIQPQVSYPVGTNPRSVAVSDFNGDGRIDLVTANAGSASVTVLQNNGTGGFISQGSYTVGANPSAAAVGDFNDDSQPDVVASNTNSNTVSLLHNTSPNCGYGVFPPPSAYTVGTLPRGIVIADFDKDGYLDQAAANTTSNTVSVLLNDSTGSFAAQVTYPVGTSPDSIAAGDFNNDSYPDLVTSNLLANTVSVLINDGSGGFLAQAPYAVGQNPYGVSVGDFNTDGKLDLAVANYTGNSVSVLLNNGSGAFLVNVDYPVGTNPAAVTVADFNLDGNPDLALPNYGSNNVSVLLNNGSAGFPVNTTYPVGTGPTYLTTGDFNADGRPDLVVVNFNGGGSSMASVLLNTGSGAFGAQTPYSVGNGSYSVAMDDFNTDGQPDLAVANRDSNNVSVLFGNRNGTFQTQAIYPVGTYPRSIASGDFNHDGKPDLTTADSTAGTVSVLLNQVNASSSLVFHSLGSGSWSNSAIWQCRVPGATDTVTIDAGHTVTLGDDRSIRTITIDGTLATSNNQTLSVGGDWYNNGTFTPANGAVSFNGSTAQAIGGTVSTTFNNVTLQNTLQLSNPTTIAGNLTIETGGIFNANGHALTITGDFNNGGTYNAGGNTVTFNGTGTQMIVGSTTFHNVVVGSASVLTSSDNVVLDGALTNNGWTSETKNISAPGTVSFGLGEISIDVSTLGSLSSVEVDRRDTDHPAGALGQQTGRYWAIDPNTDASGYNASLTLPAAFTPSSTDQVCRYTGSAWDCAQTSHTASSITRTGITQFSEWTVLRYYSTTTAVSSDDSSSVYGQSVTFTATVSAVTGTPGGTVTFRDGANLLGSQTLNGSGVATLSTSTLAVGTHTITAAYEGAGLYLASSGTLPGGQVVGPAPITVAAYPQTRVYGETDPTLTYHITSGALATGDSFTGSLTRASGEGVGPHAILQGSLALSSNYTLTYVGANLTITARPVTVAAYPQTRVYGDTDPALTHHITSGSLVFSDAFTGSLTRAAGENVGPHAILQGSLALTSNYNLTYVGDNLTITARPVTVTANPQTKVYGDTGPTLSYHITSGSLVFSDAFTGSLAPAAGEDVGPHAILQGSLALTSNYNLTYVGDILTITARPVTVTAYPQTRVYGGTDPTLTHHITSGSLAFSDAFTGSLTRAAGENIGDYAISQGSLALSSNYTLTYVGANLTITPATLTVTADNKNRLYLEPNPPLTYTITGLVNNDTMAVVSGSPLVSTDATQASLPGAYTITITIGDLQASNYNFTPVNGSLSITGYGVFLPSVNK